MNEPTKKRKNDSDSSAVPLKKVKLTETSSQSAASTSEPVPQLPPRRRINKLKAPRPFPTVPASVSATGPRSAHKEGKNAICITRKTSLGAYMRRCKNTIIQDGYVSPSLSIRQYVTDVADIKPFILAQWVQLFRVSFN
jgi:hypothetical protein